MGDLDVKCVTEKVSDVHYLGDKETSSPVHKNAVRTALKYTPSRL